PVASERLNVQRGLHKGLTEALTPVPHKGNDTRSSNGTDTLGKRDHRHIAAADPHPRTSCPLRTGPCRTAPSVDPTIRRSRSVSGRGADHPPPRRRPGCRGQRAGRAAHRPRSSACSAMWWISSRLAPARTETNGSPGSDPYGYREKPTVSSCASVTPATLSRQRSSRAQNARSAGPASGLKSTICFGRSEEHT